MIKFVFYFSFGIVAGVFLGQKVGYVSMTEAKNPTAFTAQVDMPDKKIVSLASAQPVEKNPPSIYGSAVLHRKEDGHYWAEANINQTSVNFMVDTGASMVALTRPDAEKIGLYLMEKDYTGIAQTPNGKVKIAQVNLNEISVGKLKVRNVPAVVIDHDEGTSLLGMTFLNRLREFSFQGDKMIMNE